MKKTFIFICIIATLFISCSKSKDEEIVFDNSYPLALAPDVSWAVVTDPYAAYKSEPEWSADAMGHCRKSDILQVIGKSVDSKNNVWYYFADGWLPASSIAIYSNRYKAKTASNQLAD